MQNSKSWDFILSTFIFSNAFFSKSLCYQLWIFQLLAMLASDLYIIKKKNGEKLSDAHYTTKASLVYWMVHQSEDSPTLSMHLRLYESAPALPRPTLYKQMMTIFSSKLYPPPSLLRMFKSSFMCIKAVVVAAAESLRGLCYHFACQVLAAHLLTYQ